MNGLERMVIGLVVILTVAGMWAARSPYQVTVPQAVLYDGHARQVSQLPETGPWATWQVAYDEFAIIEDGLGIPAPSFTYRERFVWGYQGWVSYRWDDGWQFEMVLRPLYPSREYARLVAAHELGHIYAIAHLGDATEETANLFAACWGSGGDPAGDGCEALRDGLRGGDEHGA